MTDSINLIKLCVGTETPDDLALWQASHRASLPDTLPRHVTRMWPKRAAELLNGGSLYWVFKGVVLARQKVLRLDEVTGPDGIARCGIVLDPDIIRTAPAPRRPFQGWRYLKPEDAPPDISDRARREDPLPAALNAALAEIGVL
ncbi:DUF1489 domain-containing protein [Marinovum sp. 2_MG-2023]|uniref:DUF1489 family protein n=1 Tax=Roseobacteraceae TaxID=2854170 RepID=UPI001FD32497|nr:MULTISPECIES: DUF1489 domain-containing protein [Roseobacteraceae]MCJ7871145.1 DUF1489 domain-containing protein [Phaeobacter sp. J2-8]MDO6729628.1 DUF1489 domain-containing protein [Marinovum sp. 2_MG-2023]MDO6779442.1 DUF1489 domain-containing protein [Marinovum sp. 1_MG-2023]